MFCRGDWFVRVKCGFGDAGISVSVRESCQQLLYYAFKIVSIGIIDGFEYSQFSFQSYDFVIMGGFLLIFI